MNRQKSISKRILKYVITSFMALSLVLLAACGGGSSSSSGGSKGKDTIYLGMVNPPSGFNPINTSDIAGQFAIRVMLDSFLDMTSPLKFQPKLATSIDTTDNQTYTIHLNPKAKWTDGKPVTADDVIFTFNLIANPKSTVAVGSNISTLEGLDANGKLTGGKTSIPDLKKIDEHTVSFKTKTPVDPNYIKEMIGTKIITMPQHVLKDIAPADFANSKYAQAPNVTNGPYKFVTYNKNTYIQYKANNSYYLGKPKTPKFFIKIMQAPNLLSELQAGTIQANASGGIGNLPFQDVDTAKKLKNVTTEIHPQIGFQTMEYNTKTLSNPKIRQAIAYAIDRPQIVDKLLKGNGEIIDGPYTSQSPYLDKSTNVIKYDPKKAKQMLKDAGWDFNKTLNFVVPIGNKVREQSADIIVQNFKAIGVKVKETTYDFPTIMQKGAAGDFDLLLIGFTFNIDPDVSALYGPNGAYNFMKYENPKATKLIADGKSQPDSAKRKAIYSQLQSIWEKDMPVLTLYSDNEVVVKSKDLAYGGASSYWPGTVADFQKWAYKK
ncbi:ABC transporter substrate-binding protein [Sporolactobacillus laevolacticus]|uniref:ABC transporter substrate-binding protein n=1 Tax=Sporolactobacillus laevolacticus TaxID=33018 RepID=UPI0025B506F5|nr:ABC transporter substrate-binding protein [Sporolactobacillus laevolacticus]MDN3954965.1 ABC transporter substrate-binding protein [Sporolactobacillus laevolacticus]